MLTILADTLFTAAGRRDHLRERPRPGDGRRHWAGSNDARHRLNPYRDLW